MTPVRNTIVLKRRFRALKKRRRFFNRAEHRRHMRLRILRLRQRLRLDLIKKQQERKQRRVEKRKLKVAKRETAKLNRTLKRRRKK